MVLQNTDLKESDIVEEEEFDTDVDELFSDLTSTTD
jgi:hypothetical protein